MSVSFRGWRCDHATNGEWRDPTGPRQPVQLSARTSASRPSSVTMTSGASCTWSRRRPRRHCRRRPCTRAAPTCSCRSPAWRDRLDRSPTVRRHHGPSRPPGTSLVPRARPTPAPRGRRRRTAGCRRCRRAWSPRSCEGSGHPRGAPVATNVASRRRAAYRISAKGRSGLDDERFAEELTVLPLAGDGFLSCFVGRRRRRRLRLRLRRGGRARGRRSAPDQQPAHHANRRLAPSPHLEETRGPSTLLSDHANPLWTRGSEAGGVSVVGAWIVLCPARTPRLSTWSSVGWTSSPRSVRSSASTGERREFLLRVARAKARWSPRSCGSSRPPTTSPRRPVTGPPPRGWRPDPGRARDRTPPRGVGCRSRVAVDPDRRCPGCR